MTGFVLRIIAMVTMLIDHVACNLLNAGTLSTVMRSIGRLAFPIYAFLLAEGFLIFYKDKKILERHRHRYEFNNKYRELLEENGMVFSGINEKANLVEIIELPKHKHFIACQFHPEFKSRPTRPHPLFCTLIENSIKKK